MSQHNYASLQRETVDQVSNLIRASGHVLGLFLWGSMSLDRHDPFSDIDLICFLDTEAKTGRKELFQQVGNLYPLLCDFYLYDRYALYLFANGIRLDLDFYAPNEVKQIDRQKARILYDPNGFLQQHITDHPSEQSPKPSWNDEEGDFALWFLWMFRQVYCWCRRAEQNSYTAFDKLLGAYNSVYEVRNKLIDVQRYLMPQRDYLQKAEPEFAERIAKTFPQFTPSSILAANDLLLQEYERLLPEYCRRNGQAFPAGKVKLLKAMIADLDRY